MWKEVQAWQVCLVTIHTASAKQALRDHFMSTACRPTAAYAPWFNVVLKSARLAVSVLTMLSKEVLRHPPFLTEQ